MFGKAPRGVSQRPKTRENTRAIPSWLWLVVLVLAGICVAIFLSLWSPWKPVERKTVTQGPMSVNGQETNKDYRFYDMLPQQQVTPIPDQAVPEHQVEQPVVVVEAPARPTTETSEEVVSDPFDENYPTAQISVSPRFILQVRSYEDPDSADARRAEIVLNGLSAEVIMTNEGEKVWYRVISGPYHSKESAHIAQQTLQHAGIDSIIVQQSTKATH
ncbi:Sporulation related domain-containing protein [Acinetobacter marinus]|uniref:Sporulation related domain-containing protein n=1 Tax=Acinetobacter marinus TaxID=281375 RepID=A0A1G6HBV7_9GAMM|nr:SPOR domain-containing protein [Acinetobacter marinus]SDB91681.1 Sporulation related domain-containing protein [Acinetobacter marinus]